MSGQLSMGASLAVYIISFLSVCFFGRLYSRSRSRIGSIFSLVLIWLVLTIFAGYRVGVGTDFYTYADTFYQGYGYFEPGSRAIYEIARFFSNDAQSLFIAFASITNLFLILVLRRIKAKYPNVSIFFVLATWLFVFYPISFNAMRQMLSVIIVIYAVITALDNKRFLPIILVVIAASIHTSAAVMLPFLFVYMISTPQKLAHNIIVLLIIAIAVIIATPYLKGVPIVGAYVNYLKGFSIGSLDIMLLLSYVPFILLLFIYGGNITEGREKTYFTSLFLCGTILEILFSLTYASRIGLYLSSISMLLFPMMIPNIRDVANRRTIILMYAVYLICYFILTYYIHGRAGVFPYQNLLFGAS